MTSIIECHPASVAWCLGPLPPGPITRPAAAGRVSPEETVATCSTHRRRPLPAVHTPEQALEVLGLATDEGRDRVIALACLDRERRPLTMFIVEESAAGPAELLVVGELLIDALVDADAEGDGPS